MELRSRAVAVVDRDCARPRPNHAPAGTETSSGRDEAEGSHDNHHATAVSTACPRTTRSRIRAASPAPLPGPGADGAVGDGLTSATCRSWSGYCRRCRLARPGGAPERMRFRCRCTGIDLHFLHVGRGPAPCPLLLSHGWPGSMFEFLDLIPLPHGPARFGGDPADAFTWSRRRCRDTASFVSGQGASPGADRRLLRRSHDRRLGHLASPRRAAMGRFRRVAARRRPTPTS